jgi:hypothetical protein
MNDSVHWFRWAGLVIVGDAPRVTPHRRFVAWSPRHLRNWSNLSTIFGDFSTASQTADPPPH